MERLLDKIRDLEREAQKLASKSQEDGRDLKEEQHCDHGQNPDWIQEVRRSSGEWTDKPLVVLSLFDGIGGVWVALDRLGIPFIGYSCEVKQTATQVVKHRYGNVHHFGDVMDLDKDDIQEKVDLVIGGFPCQDLSCMGLRRGLHGSRSRLFFEMLRIIKVFKPTWFLAENVASMSWVDRLEISKHLGTNPIEIDSEMITPSKRKRIYWSNIPYPDRIPKIRDHESTSLQSVLQNATALDKKIGCILSNNNPTGNVRLELVRDDTTNKLRDINVVEVELAMGYPRGYTSVKFKQSPEKTSPSSDNRSEVSCTTITRYAGDKVLRSKIMVQASPKSVQEIRSPKSPRNSSNTRWNLLGNTFSVPVICYLLSPLLNRDVRRAPRPICLPKNIKESECSAMDPGEVWALYNGHQRPNWYAVIVSRSGDRFSDAEIQQGQKRPPVDFEVKFMEMSAAYAAREPDEWNTNRGTGLFHVRGSVDKQTSWIAFSHRVSTFLKVDDNYFIYPCKDEVWAIYDADSKACEMLVYVTASYISKKAKEGVPGKEGFFARCRLLQRTEPELYRFLDKEIKYTDLSVFSFRAPFHYKNESNLLRVELTRKQRKQIGDGGKPSKRRKRDFDSESEEEEEAEEVGSADSDAAVLDADD
ncbi:hypothetical protein R1sor_018424 [Riccia sorocarpa]|uniref:DNA (cytosine-5-)-methyltransferase n=1 Tax=Riccia sorocarpa TaxID=122646 RepID=A0ABD3ICD5_9MARC